MRGVNTEACEKAINDGVKFFITALEDLPNGIRESFEFSFNDLLDTNDHRLSYSYVAAKKIISILEDGEQGDLAKLSRAIDGFRFIVLSRLDDEIEDFIRFITPTNLDEADYRMMLQSERDRLTYGTAVWLAIALLCTYYSYVTKTD